MEEQIYKYKPFARDSNYYEQIEKVLFTNKILF